MAVNVVALQVGNSRMNEVTLTGTLVHARGDQFPEDSLCGAASIEKHLFPLFQQRSRIGFDDPGCGPKL